MSNVVVLDNGSHSIKYGTSYEKIPLEIETIVGIERGNKKPTSDSYFVGLSEIEKERKEKLISQRYPIQHGSIMDWDQMESCWNYCFKSLNAK
jgi:actin-related protein